MILYFTILYFTILYFTILCYTALYFFANLVFLIWISVKCGRFKASIMIAGIVLHKFVIPCNVVSL